GVRSGGGLAGPARWYSLLPAVQTPQEGAMRNRAFHGVLGVVLLMSLACGGGGGEARTESAPAAPQGGPGGSLQQVGPGEGEVSIVAWAGYVERGETDKN